MADKVEILDYSREQGWRFNYNPFTGCISGHTNSPDVKLPPDDAPFLACQLRSTGKASHSVSSSVTTSILSPARPQWTRQLISLPHSKNSTCKTETCSPSPQAPPPPRIIGAAPLKPFRSTLPNSRTLPSLLSSCPMVMKLTYSEVKSSRCWWIRC